MKQTIIGLLDAYFWRLGKYENGNHSLLLERNDYKESCIQSDYETLIEVLCNDGRYRW